MNNRFFIAGTDTGVGKTWVSSLLLRAAASQGLLALGLKPVAAGADQRFNEGLENEDAIALLSATNVDITMRELNPVCLTEPLSPHISAERDGVNVDVDALVAASQAGLKKSADLCLVEGAGGWRVPINNSETMADFACALGFPVILVVGMRLGCLNHAMLTVEAIQRDGLQLHGWVANELTASMPALEENIATLKRHIAAPMIARVGFGQKYVGVESGEHVDIRKSLLS